MSQSLPTTVLEPKRITKTKYNPRWRVIGLNDDVTTMEYVVLLLQEVFHKTAEQAFRLMMEVHESGAATFYLGTREACELKVEQVRDMNKAFDQHLQVRMEPIEDEE